MIGRIRHHTAPGVLAAACAVAVVAVAACSGGQSTSAGSSGGASVNAASCSSPGVSPTSITVAAIAPLTGPAAPTFNGFIQAAQARISAQNAAGGVNGRKIKLVTDDDQASGAQQVVAARNAVQSQDAFGIIGASAVDTMFGYLDQQDVPVTGYPGQSEYSTQKNVFGFAGAFPDTYVSTALAARMKAAGATSVADLANNSPGAVDSADGFAAAAQKVGLKVGVTRLDVPVGSFDATSLAVQLASAHIDSVVTFMTVDSGISILKALQAQGVTLKTTYLGGDYDPAVSSQVSSLIQGGIGTPLGTVPTQLDTSGTKAYIATMKKYAPSTNPDAYFASPGYVSADLFIKGLQVAGACPTRAAFVSKLRAVTNYDGAGLLVTPTSFQPAETPDGTPYTKCAWYAVYRGSSWVPDKAASCGSLIKFGG
jgi:branched-chain amino acid transport system substrate-binding protein